MGYPIPGLDGGYPISVGGGYPISGWGGTPSQVRGTQGIPPARSGWGSTQSTPHPDLGSGTPHLDLGRGTPYLRWGPPYLDLGQGTPHLRWGTPPLPEMGYPPPITQSSIASTCYAVGGVPLAFTQEDFLVIPGNVCHRGGVCLPAFTWEGYPHQAFTWGEGVPHPAFTWGTPIQRCGILPSRMGIPPYPEIGISPSSRTGSH